MTTKQRCSEKANRCLEGQEHENVEFAPVFEMANLVNQSHDDNRNDQCTRSGRDKGYDDPETSTLDQRSKPSDASLLAKTT